MSDTAVAPSVHTSDADPIEDQDFRVVASRALGDVAVPVAAIMRFPVPLGGFSGEHEYALLPAARDGMWLLQSTQEPGLVFVLGDPFMHDASFAVDLSPADKDTLELVDEVDALALVMFVLSPTGGPQCTANFRAPLVFNVRNRRGVQVVSRDDRHELQRSVSLDAYPVAGTH